MYLSSVNQTSWLLSERQFSSEKVCHHCGKNLLSTRYLIDLPKLNTKCEWMSYNDVKCGLLLTK